MAEFRFTPPSDNSFEAEFLAGHLLHANFVDLSMALKRQVERRSHYWFRGIHYDQVQFILKCNDEWRASKGEFVICHNEFWFGLVGTHFGSFISFPKNVIKYPSDFWLKTLPNLFEDSCRQMILVSVHDS